jgi:hypothetical protein
VHAAEDDAAERGLEVDVVEEQVHRLAAQFEEDGLQRSRRGLHHPPTCCSRSREGHHVDIG